MSEILGQALRLRINTGTTQAPAWKTIKGEVSASINPTSDKVEVANKDVGKHKKFIKLQLDHTLSVNATEYVVVGANELSFADIYGFYQKNNSDAGGGIYPMEFYTATVGAESIAFNAFVETCTLPADNNGVIEYSFNLQVVSLPVATTAV